MCANKGFSKEGNFNGPKNSNERRENSKLGLTPSHSLYKNQILNITRQNSFRKRRSRIFYDNFFSKKEFVVLQQL